MGYDSPFEGLTVVFEPRRGALPIRLAGASGMMSSNKGEDGIPHRVMFIPVDMATGLYSFQALSSALYARRDEDKGCYIDNSLMRSGIVHEVLNDYPVSRTL